MYIQKHAGAPARTLPSGTNGTFCLFTAKVKNLHLFFCSKSNCSSHSRLPMSDSRCARGGFTCRGKEALLLPTYPRTT